MTGDILTPEDHKRLHREHKRHLYWIAARTGALYGVLSGFVSGSILVVAIILLRGEPS